MNPHFLGPYSGPAQGAPPPGDGVPGAGVSESAAPEASLFDDDDKHVWSGFITRNKRHRVGVDAYAVQGEDLFEQEYNINVSHRVPFEEVGKFKPVR